jgi:putative tryptophan/tyrosine transport system substrate-binding protein
VRRRAFIGLLGGAASSFASRAQQMERMRRVGVLMLFADDDPEARSRVSAFARALRELGWKEGHNIQIEYRFAAGDVDRMRSFAKEYFDLPIDVIVSNSAQPIIDLRQETRSTIPVVYAMAHNVGLAGLGLVSSMSHPGGNMTGFTTFEPSIVGKWLELLKAVAQSVRHIGFLFNPDASRSTCEVWLRQLQAAATSLAVEPLALPVHHLTEMRSALVALGREPDCGLLVLPDALTVANYATIDALALEHRIPACYPSRFFATGGGLMSYGPNGIRVFQQAASYVNRILSGADPGDLPIQQPNAFELVINLKTAKAMGLTAPPWSLARADEVIE